MQIDVLTGEFALAADEAAFLRHRQAKTQPLLGFTLLVCALFYLAFSLTDLAVLGFGTDFLALLAARLLVAFTAAACAWRAYQGRLSIRAMRLAATLPEALALACFMFIASRRPDEFHWHAMSLAIMLIVVYIYIPNRPRNALVVALVTTAVFLLLAWRLAQMRAPDVITMSMLLILANAFGALAARRLNQAARDAYLAHMQLQHAAERDHLTGCYNRRYLHEHLMRSEQIGAMRQQRSLTVILCDIDHFKRINDTYGHAGGDTVISRFGQLLIGLTRPGVDHVIRYGGEEFLAILPGAGLAAGVDLAEALRTQFAASAGPLIPTTASFGIASADFGDASADWALDDLIAAADKLMYEAKHSGRNCVRALQL